MTRLLPFANYTHQVGDDTKDGSRVQNRLVKVLHETHQLHRTQSETTSSYLKSKGDREKRHEDPIDLPDQRTLSLLASLLARVDDGRVVLRARGGGGSGDEAVDDGRKERTCSLEAADSSWPFSLWGATTGAPLWRKQKSAWLLKAQPQEDASSFPLVASTTTTTPSLRSSAHSHPRPLKAIPILRSQRTPPHRLRLAPFGAFPTNDLPQLPPIAQLANRRRRLPGIYQRSLLLRIQARRSVHRCGVERRHFLSWPGGRGETRGVRAPRELGWRRKGR